MTVIRLPYVHRFIDRHGRGRHYFRRRSGKATPLPGIPDSSEFMAAYQAALDALPAAKKPVEIGASRTNPGSLNALVVTYYKSTEWTALAPPDEKAASQHHRAISRQARRQACSNATARKH